LADVLSFDRVLGVEVVVDVEESVVEVVVSVVAVVVDAVAVSVAGGCAGSVAVASPVLSAAPVSDVGSAVVTVAGSVGVESPAYAAPLPTTSSVAIAKASRAETNRAIGFW
jgi:hypothetical protein